MLKEPAAAAAVAAAASATSCGYEDSGSKACWLCLCGEESGPLRRPCACPSMYSHPRCLARWQLQQAGHDEEQRCRFCREVLPPWTSALAALQEAQCGAAGGCGCDADSVAGAGIASSSANSLVAAAEPAPAIGFIKVIFNGQAMRVPCMPGADGKRIFTMMVRMMFDLPDDVDLDFTFELKVPQMLPHSGGTVILKGIETFDAASTVAAMYQRQKNPSRGVCASQVCALRDPQREAVDQVVSSGPLCGAHRSPHRSHFQSPTAAHYHPPHLSHLQSQTTTHFPPRHLPFFQPTTTTHCQLPHVSRFQSPITGR